MTAPAGEPDLKTVTVVWLKTWEDVPFTDPASCPHPGTAALAIGMRLEPHGRGRRFVQDALLCMLCGTDSAGKMNPEDALGAAWDEHGWHVATGGRILALADRATAA